ncbi:uncharacterized protein DS421_11g320540 [Arachis hypogaea]|nr:uncharacterized protein DS421_11g320540 [Arachis hypogaea]
MYSETYTYMKLLWYLLRFFCLFLILFHPTIAARSNLNFGRVQDHAIKAPPAPKIGSNSRP